MGTRTPTLTLLIACSLAGCMGDLPSDASKSGDSANKPGSSSSSSAPTPGPLLRLTATQYNNTVRDLLGDTTAPATGILVDDRAGPFTSNAVTGVSPTTVQALQTLAQGVAQRAVQNMNTLLGCDPNQMSQDANYETSCIQRFVPAFGAKAFRRPLTSDETQDLTTLYATLRTSNPVPDSVAALLTAYLQNPFFVYRAEMLTAPQGRDYAIASRLSYFLWDSMPGAALLQAAAAGNLHTAAQVAAQVPRMLDDARAQNTLHRFHREWLAVDTLTSIGKSPTLFPQYTPALVASMQGETDHFVDSVWNTPGDNFNTLLTAPYSLVDGNMASLYGLPAPTGDANAFTQATLSNRAGIVTQAAFLAVHAHEDQSDIVHRGLFVRTVLFCQNMPSPPGNVVISVPPIDPNTSTRQRQELHRANPACAGCHALMDPLGDGFENFDAIGQYRTTDGPTPVDASGTISQTDVNGNYSNAINFMQILSQSTEVRQCYARQWLRYALGRMDAAGDAATLAAIQNAFAQSGFNQRALLTALANSNAILTP